MRAARYPGRGRDGDRPRRRRLSLPALGRHELGRWASRQFRKIIGDERRWRTKPGEIGLSPHEIFAEAYSLCARKRSINRAVIELPPIRIGPHQHDAICALIGESYKLEPARVAAPVPAGSSSAAATATAPADR